MRTYSLGRAQAHCNIGLVPCVLHIRTLAKKYDIPADGNEWDKTQNKASHKDFGEAKMVREIHNIYTFGASINACLCHLN